MRLAPLGRCQHVPERLAVKIVAADGVRAERARLARHGRVGALAQQHDRSKAGTAGELARPVEAAAAGPFIGQQHRIESLCQELARERALRDRAVHHQLCLRAPGDEPLPDVRAAVRVFFDQQQAHRAELQHARAHAAMTLRKNPRLRQRQLQSDHQVPDVGAGGAGMQQIAARGERTA